MPMIRISAYFLQIISLFKLCVVNLSTLCSLKCTQTSAFQTSQHTWEAVWLQKKKGTKISNYNRSVLLSHFLLLLINLLWTLFYSGIPNSMFNKLYYIFIMKYFLELYKKIVPVLYFSASLRLWIPRGLYFIRVNSVQCLINFIIFS